MCRVLLVEDEPLIAMMLEDEITDRGHTVVGIATSVVDALRLINRTVPDVAVVDYQLSDGNCHEVTRALERHGIAFVLLTGALIEKSDTRFANVEVLAKPVDIDRLMAVLMRLRHWTIGPRPGHQSDVPAQCL